MVASSPALAAHAWLLTTTWDVNAGNRAISEAGRFGYAAIEIPVVHPCPLDLRSHRNALARAGLAALCRTALPGTLHFPQEAERAFYRTRRVLDVVAELESRLLVASFGWAAGARTDEPPSRTERALAVEVLAALADEASQRGITLAIEPGNRYETSLYNTLSETAATVLAVGSPALRIAADTRTLQMEETSIRNSLVGASDLLVHVTIRESHGGEAGTGTIHWDDVWQALARIGFDGWLVYRCDNALSTTTPPGAQLWRTDLRPGSSVAASGLTFLRNGVRRMQEGDAEPPSGTPAVPQPVSAPQSKPAAKTHKKPRSAPKSSSSSPAAHDGDGGAPAPRSTKKGPVKPASGKSYRARPSR